MRGNKWAILGCFLLYFVKTCHDVPSNASCLKCITTSYIIIKTNDVMSFYDVVTSLVMSPTVHVQQVTCPIGIKRGLHVVWGFTQILPPENFKRLDHLKHTQVVMRLVHPYDWSLLPSTVFEVLS